MAPLSRRARRALAVGAGATVAYAAAVAYRRARDAALEAPDARTERLEEARALAALERELAALDEETLRGSGASAPSPAAPRPRRQLRGLARFRFGVGHVLRGRGATARDGFLRATATTRHTATSVGPRNRRFSPEPLG
jgi:hypothetical protein